MEIKIRKGEEVFPCFTYPSWGRIFFAVREGHESALPSCERMDLVELPTAGDDEI
jgi:hypothetical protein